MRDIHGDYRRAYIEEYEAYQRVGRTEDAEHIAGILRDQYDHDVTQQEPELERADHKAPEATVPDRPAARKQPARRKKATSGGADESVLSDN